MARTRHLDFDEGADSSRFVTALARGLDVLACFHVDEKWLTNAEIASRTGLPKPTVVRMAYTLVFSIMAAGQAGDQQIAKSWRARRSVTRARA